jgi:ATP-dependent DNA helicase RecG
MQAHRRVMRPAELFDLFAPLERLPGIGPRLAGLLARAVGGERVLDAAFHLPTGVVDRRFQPKINDAPIGATVTIRGLVERHLPGQGEKRPYRVRLSDDTGFLTLVFFRGDARQLERSLPVGSERLVSGEIGQFNGERQMTHPAWIGPPDAGERIARVEPIYPSTAGLSLKVLARAVDAAVQKTPELAEWIDPQMRAREGWASFRDALIAAHAPASEADLAPEAPARRRLAYDEAFARALMLELTAEARRRLPAAPLSGDGRLVGRLRAALPYAPTGAQERAIADIFADMGRTHPMLRLLMGDVGSGKTLVAAFAMVRAAEAGAQSALMAPTDLLARQHAAGLAPLLASAGLRLEVLTGKTPAAARNAILSGLADGSVHAVCGTQALFQDATRFARLGLVVVDEQHRFGVADRRRLIDKGDGAHMLAMSATPIPRTLALTVHGDLDVSRLDEKPPGRAPVTTRAVPLDRMDEVVAAAARAMTRDDRVYWVCPLVADSAELDVAAAQDRFAMLRAALGDGVVLAHGQMATRERDAAMDAFRTGAARLLVATTIIEVGVDVPEASIMVIEHAERFGLAQLHQLRGRVGRGGKPGACILLYRAPLGATARARIEVLRATDDGFVIAEEDYRLRGGGDVLGVRQSGLPAFRLCDPFAHADLFEATQADARALLLRDPDLASTRGRAARAVLSLFDHAEAENRLTTG